MDDIIDELSWRGLIAVSTDLDELRAALNSGRVTCYAGFDPTAPGLHIGHLWEERRHLAPFVDLLISELAAGRLTPVVARTFALEHVADAHRFIQERGNIGKVVLTV